MIGFNVLLSSFILVLFPLKEAKKNEIQSCISVSKTEYHQKITFSEIHIYIPVKIRAAESSKGSILGGLVDSEWKKMVLSSQVALAVANTSANLCQYIACNPERLSNDEVLDLIFCFPFQQFRRFSLCIWTFFCFPAADPFSLFSDGEDHHYN